MFLLAFHLQVCRPVKTLVSTVAFQGSSGGQFCVQRGPPTSITKTELKKRVEGWQKSNARRVKIPLWVVGWGNIKHFVKQYWLLSTSVISHVQFNKPFEVNQIEPWMLPVSALLYVQAGAWNVWLKTNLTDEWFGPKSEHSPDNDYVWFSISRCQRWCVSLAKGVCFCSSFDVNKFLFLLAKLHI